MGFAVKKIGVVGEVCIFVLGLFILPVVISEVLKCNQNDLKALQGFLASLETGIKGWDSTNSTNSSASNCCSWDWVTCNNNTDNSTDDSGRVVKLEISGKRLVGTLSDSLGNLDHLTTLNLSRNSLEGSIPIKLLNLPNLEVLDLSNNGFSGLFPMSMNLPLIRVLDISFNKFQGSVPVGICNNSTRIQALKMAANSFAGNFTSGLGNCTSLVELSLASNFLSGGLPDDLFRLERLERLDLQDNRFSGQLIGTSFGNLSNLFHLDISFNELSGVIPDVFLPLKKLNYFSAQSNKFTGGIPESLANSPSICSLSLRNNSLSGSIDLNCTAMTSLVSLELATNGFHGPLPANLPACPQLKVLNLAKNSFHGGIPESYMSFKYLTQLSLSSCSLVNLSSALTTLQHIPNLTTLVLTFNFLDEQLPSDDPSIQFINLKALVIANCRLTGTIPRWLVNSPGLELLDLSWNLLQGNLPPWFSGFQSLFYLDLSNNSFSGEIPKEITQLESLILGNVSRNDPSPDIPFFVKRNVSAGGLQYNQIFSFPSTLRLSNNFLTGPIWPEFGNLKNLHVLELKCNNLSGSIPNSLSAMTSLETLDLSRNNLSGTIPFSLVNLTFLSKFSIAYNMLSGMIPLGGQFATFPNSSFEHNLDLCGNHGYPPCSNQTSALLGKREKAPKRTIIGTALGIGLGTVILVALVYMIVIRATRRKPVDPENEEDGLHKEFEDLGSNQVIIFEKNSREIITLDELVKSTNYFDQSNIIGCGGFGLVYKAVLCDGRKVAIKRLSNDGGQMEREFQAEVETLSRAKHPNLVHLQGYCRYKNDRLLIYSFMENGSLDYWLHEKTDDGPSSLNWETRLRIAQGAARGLAYLHQSCDPHILHRDIKSSNILLDENFEARLADFGFARLIFPYDTHVTTDLVGTLGYIPPEYGQASIATFKGDIYSFGVVLLELLTGRRPMEVSNKPKGSRELISWVMQMKSDKKENGIFDPLIYDENHAQEMLWVLEIACLCLNESPKSRPSTQQLVSLLDKTGSCDVASD